MLIPAEQELYINRRRISHKPAIFLSQAINRNQNPYKFSESSTGCKHRHQLQALDFKLLEFPGSNVTLNENRCIALLRMVIPNHKNETLSTLFAIKTLFSQNSISTDAVDNTSAKIFFVLNIIYIGKSTFIHKYYSDYLKFHPMTKILPTIKSAILARSLTMARRLLMRWSHDKD